VYCGWSGWREGLAVDASLIVADANKQRSMSGKQWSKELDAQAVSQHGRWLLERSLIF
jgi:hypothetical protein